MFSVAKINIFKTQLYIESQRISPHFYLVIGIVGGVICCKRREAKRSEPCVASTEAPWINNPAYEPLIGKTQLIAAHAGDSEMPKETHTKLTSKNSNGNVYQSIDRGKEEDPTGRMHEYIEMKDKSAIRL